MTGRDLLNMMIAEGVEIKEDHDFLIDEFDRAIEERRILPLRDDSNIIGYITFERRLGRVLLNKGFIFRKFRSRFSLLKAKRRMRKLFDGVRFTWKSKRRGRICSVT